MEQHLPADSQKNSDFVRKVSEAHQPEFYFREEEPHFPPQPEHPPWQ